MARHITKRDIEPILSAARTWINDCLIADGSLFSDRELWTPALVEEVRAAFVDNPDESSDKFMVKLERQLAPASSSAKRLMAELIWGLLLFPSNMKAGTKRTQIAQAWAWSGEPFNEGHSFLSDEVLAGIGSGGQAFHSLRYRELAFLLGLVKGIKALDPAERVKVFSDYDAFEVWIDTVPEEGHRQFRHMLRYFSFPDRVERMSSNRDRRQIIGAFKLAPPAELKHWTDRQLDTALLDLRGRLEADHPGAVIDFYEPPVEHLWRKEEEISDDSDEEVVDDKVTEPDAEEGDRTRLIDVPSDALKPKNVILYGPPGTGKTHWLRQKFDDYTDRAMAVDKETWLQETVSGFGWRALIAAVLAQFGGSARVAEVREHPWFLAKMRQRGRNPATAGNVIWGYLQSHTPADDPNVAYSQRRAPFIFRKLEGAKWRLVDDWRDLDDESATLERLLQAGVGSGRDPIRRYRVVTFHPSFSYEEFIRGIRPVQQDEDANTQFRLVDGVFKQACDEARANPSKRYAFFIDEINRANIAKVFGELITLIEADKRAVYDSAGRLTSGMVIQLPGGEGTDAVDPPFGVPANLDIFGTMNTADRSIALLDIALRRRFEFIEMEPDYSTLDRFVGGVHLGRLLHRINDRLEYFVDRDHRIGHAYFISVQHLVDLRLAVKLKVIPLLQEYFFDDFARVAAVLATAGDAAPLVQRERLRFENLFPGPLGDHTTRERDRFSVTPDTSWTEASFIGIYEAAAATTDDEELASSGD
jgi:5-methylcytosine-specific restriction protein B